MKKNIFFWGAKYKAGIIFNYIKKKEILYVPKDVGVGYLFDPETKKPPFLNNAKFSNKQRDLSTFIKKSKYFVACVGNQYGKARYIISKKLEKNLIPLSIIHKKSIITDKSNLGKGVQIFPSSVINENSLIGDYSIVNTSSLVEHDCKIGTGVHIMPGAVLGGNVVIEDFVTVGMNSTILPNIKIETGAFIGAGSVVTKNVKKNQLVLGNPAKFKKKNNIKIKVKYI